MPKKGKAPFRALHEPDDSPFAADGKKQKGKTRPRPGFPDGADG
jgi:hypothetical protein